MSALRVDVQLRADAGFLEVQVQRRQALGGTEGVDVPYRITGPLAVLVESEGEATFALEVVRRQAKLDPPLTNIQQTTILTVTAQITLFGKTTSEKRVTTTGSLQIDFADFGDEETSCPQN